MKRLVTIALLLTIGIMPASAQRGGSRGGFSGRGPSSAPAFHGSLSFSSPSHFSGISRGPMPMARPAPSARPSFYSANRHPGGRYPVSRPIGNRYPMRRPAFFHNFGYPSGISYVPYSFLNAPFDGGYDLSNDEAPPIPYTAAAPDPAYGYTQPYEPASQPTAEIVRPATRRTDLPEPSPAATTTLIFKDGRAPETIRNYIATRSTVTVIDGPRHHDIPVADLDLPATTRANRESGSGFQLPAMP